MRESNTRSKVPILELPELELLIHQCNGVTLAVGCPLALLKQYRSISNQPEDQTYVIQPEVTKQYVIRPAGGPDNMYAWMVHKINVHAPVQ